MLARPDVPTSRLLWLVIVFALATPVLLVLRITYPDMDQDGRWVFDPDTDGDGLCDTQSFNANANPGRKMVDTSCSGIDANDDNDGFLDESDAFPWDPNRPAPPDRPLSNLTVDAYPEAFFGVGEIQVGYTLWVLSDKAVSNNTLGHLYDASKLCIEVREKKGTAFNAPVGTMVVVTEVVTTTLSGVMLIEGAPLMVNSSEDGKVVYQTSCLNLGY